MTLHQAQRGLFWNGKSMAISLGVASSDVILTSDFR